MQNGRPLLYIAMVLCTAGSFSRVSAATLDRGGAQECYLATLRDASPENDQAGLRVCNEAMETADNTELRADLLVNRSFIRLRMMDYPGTVADAEASLLLAPDLAEAHLNRGAGLIGLGRYREALPSLEKAVALSGADKLELAYFNRGIVRENLGDVRGAYLDYKKAAELDPKFSRAHEQLTRFNVTVGPAPDVR
jgi:tetratricopeptide (TPR) repeat protein